MPVLLTPPKLRFFDNNGSPLSGGKIYTYAPGTTTPKATYTDASGATPNANPVILDSAGYANIWISGSYKIVVKDSLDSTISTTDNITGFSTGTTGATFSDSAFTIQNASDPTKQMMFQLSGLTTGTTSVITIPSGNFTMARTSDLVGIVGNMKNGRMYVSSASATATFTADEIILETALGGTIKKLSGFSQSCNLGTTGAGGFDVGTVPVSGYVSLYAIAKADGTTSILACNATTSTTAVYGGVNMPSGYIYSAHLTTWPTNSSSQFFAGLQLDRKVWRSGVNVLNSAGGAAVTSFTSLSLTSAIPTNAKYVYGTIGAVDNNYCLAILSADSTGVIAKTLGPCVVGSGQVLDGFYATANSFELPILTAQTIWHKEVATGNSVRVNINGYEI